MILRGLRGTITAVPVPIGPNLRLLREKQSLSSERLADLVGLSFSTVLRIERGERRLHPKYLPQFAKALQMSEQELVDALAKPATPVIGNVPASFGMSLSPLTMNDARSVPSDAISIDIPDSSMMPDLPVGHFALCERVRKDRLPDAVHNQLVYVAFTPESPHGEPEFALALASGDSIILSKHNPGRGPKTITVALDEIADLRIVSHVVRRVRRA